MSLMVHRRCQSKRWWEYSWDSSRAAQSFGTSWCLLLVYDSYVTNLFFSLRFFVCLKTFHFARRPSNRFRFQFRNLLSLHCAFICFLHRYSTVNHKLDLVTLLMGALQSKYCELGWSRLISAGAWKIHVFTRALIKFKWCRSNAFSSPPGFEGSALLLETICKDKTRCDTQWHSTSTTSVCDKTMPHTCFDHKPNFLSVVFASAQPRRLFTTKLSD